MTEIFRELEYRRNPETH